MDLYGQRKNFTVADSRLPMFCTYSVRPDGFSRGPGIPANPASYISPLAQSRAGQCSGDPFIANSRLMVVPPRIRRVYAGLEPDDDDDDDPEAYEVKSPLNKPQKVSQFLDEVLNSPEMEEVESQVKKIREESQAVLKRLGESSKKKPVRLSSVYFPDLSYSPNSNSSYVPSKASSYLSSPSSSSSTSTSSSWRRPSPDRHYSPEKDDYRPRRTTYTYVQPPRIMTHDPVAEAQSEMTRRTIYEDNCRKINDSLRGEPLSTRRSRRFKDDDPDADTVKNNIEVRAQYAALRAAANVGLRKPNDYLMV